MTDEPNLNRARASFSGRAWKAAADAYAAADREAPLPLADLEQAGLATHLSGDDDSAAGLLARAHHAALEARAVPRAARTAFWLGMMLVQRGEMTVGGGWLARAGRLVEESGIDCAEAGYLLVPEGLRALDAGDPAHAFELFGRAAAIAERFDDADLATLARLGRGSSLIAASEVERGVALLDEAMVAVTAGEVGPIVAGIVYCASIEAFHSVFDLRRAQEWTDALTRWCAGQPDLVPFRGRCLVYRASLMRLHGAWPEAIEEARRAKEWLLRPPPEPAVGEALYEQAELNRLRGEYAAADDAFREAARWGRRPEPGLALLRLAQGHAAAASAMIHRALGETGGAPVRADLFDALVDISVAIGDTAAARSAVAELDTIARHLHAPLLDAMAARAEGVVRLADGDPGGALPFLRRAARAWLELDAPHEQARVRAAIGVALRQLGDADAAELEFAAAQAILADLGATPELDRLRAAMAVAPGRPGGLSEREIEVLRLLAAGLTNRAIAARLVISERTVDRHVSNIYTKLGVASRSAATAFAYERGIVEG